jgi:hypothetical protein
MGAGIRSSNVADDFLDFDTSLDEEGSGCDDYMHNKIKVKYNFMVAYVGGWRGPCGRAYKKRHVLSWSER